jgi:hypothetical protein
MPGTRRVRCRAEGESSMSSLNENHKRRLIAALQYMDKLLSQSKDALNSKPSGLYSRYIHDISETDSRWIEECIEKIREQIFNLLKRFHVELPPPSMPVSRILKTNLNSIDMAFEDLYPKKMQGYGKLDSKTASDLTSSIDETRKLFGQLRELLEK